MKFAFSLYNAARAYLKKLFHDDRGVFAPIAAVCLTSLIGFTGTAIDMGLLYSAKSQLQNAADAGAIAGADTLIIDANGDRVAEPNYSGSRAEAITFTESNPLLNQMIAWSGNDAYTAGVWDQSTNTFSQTGDSADPWDLMAVQITLNRNVGTHFFRIFGYDNVNITTKATAFLGCAGDGSGPDLPIAVNKDALTAPNQDLVFNSENEETAQWTSFFTWPANKNTIDDFIKSPEDGGTIPPSLDIGDEIFMSNGVIANLFGPLEDRFDQEKDENGVWRVILPVVEWGSGGCNCQQTNGTVVGFVNFVITEVVGTGSSYGKRLVGHMEIDNSTIAEGSQTGGECFGVRAASSKLVF